MSLIPWKEKRREAEEPTGSDNPLVSLRNEMDHLFDRFLREPFGGELDWWGGRGAWGPRLDMAESDKEVTVTVELPGVDPKEVDVEVENQTLILRGEKKQEKEKKERGYHCVERQYGTFQRRVPLPSSVDADKVDATFQQGVLTIRLAKRPEARAKRISVKGE